LQEQNENLFLAHNIWPTVNKFGKNYTKFSLKFGALIVGEIEWKFFFAKRCEQATKKVL